VVTYTLNKTPVVPTRYDGASDSAKLTAEIFERLLELEELKQNRGAALVRRLATLADLNLRGFRMVLQFGSGNTLGLLSSFDEQTENRGCTRQAVHWQLDQQLKAIRLCFPEIETLIRDYRGSVRHQEDALSSADGLREAMENRPEQPRDAGSIEQ
jgi:hypothetical protein